MTSPDASAFNESESVEVVEDHDEENVETLVGEEVEDPTQEDKEGSQ